MKKILLSLSVASVLCAGNFADFDGFDDKFDRFMHGKKSEKSQGQKATDKEIKADDKKSEKDSKKDKDADVKNLTRSFDKSVLYEHSADIEYGFSSDGDLNSIVYSFSVKNMTRTDVEYKRRVLSNLTSSIKGTLHNNGELMSLKSLISAENQAGANNAMNNLKAQLGNVLPFLKSYDAIEIIDEKHNDVEDDYHLKVKVADDIINQAKAQVK